MKVKIIKCANEDSWYHKHIGVEFEVIQAEFNADLYLATAISRQSGNGILKKDCEIVEEYAPIYLKSGLERYPQQIEMPIDYAVVGNLLVVTPDGKRYQLVPEETPMEEPQTNDPELKTFEDCFRVILPKYYLDSLNNISKFGYPPVDRDDTQQDFNLFPSEFNGEQIQAAIKLFVIHAALVPNWKYDPLGTHWKVAYYVGPGKQKLATYCDKHGVATQFMFPTEELAKKAIDIGGDLWKTYYGMK